MPRRSLASRRNLGARTPANREESDETERPPPPRDAACLSSPARHAAEQTTSSAPMIETDISRHEAPPSERDQAIFHQIAAEGRSAADIAVLHSLSESYVRQIERRVRRYCQKHDLLPTLAVAKSLYLARLEHQWRETMEAWRRSRQDVEVSKATKLTEDGKPEKTKAERTTRSQNGDVRLLRHALKILERIDAMSPVDEITSAGHGDGDLCDVQTASDDEKRAELGRMLQGIRDRIGADPDDGTDRRGSAGSAPPPATAP
jgi:hypothetical protein